MKNIKNITILGWFGNGNLGDDTILLNEIELLKEFYGDKILLNVFSHNPKLIKKNFEGIESELLPPIIWYRFYKFFNIFYFIKLYKIFKNTDLLILGGGGFFSDRQFFAISGWLRYCKIAKKLGAEVIGFGMGAGPFFHNTNRKIIKKSENIFDFISLRDEESLKCFKNCNFNKDKLIRIIDPAFFTKKNKVSKNNSIGFIIHSNEEYFIKEIKKILKNTDFNIKLIITEKLDIKINKNILEKIGDKRISLIIKDNAKEIIKNIGKCDFIISQRLHGSIIAFTQKIPFLNIFYHHKGKELISLLGIKDFSVNIEIIKKINILKQIESKNKFIFKKIDIDSYKKLLFFKLKNIGKK